MPNKATTIQALSRTKLRTIFKAKKIINLNLVSNYLRDSPGEKCQSPVLAARPTNKWPKMVVAEIGHKTAPGKICLSPVRSCKQGNTWPNMLFTKIGPKTTPGKMPESCLCSKAKHGPTWSSP